MKPLILIVLIIAIFGGAAYSTWRLYLQPKEELRTEKQRGPAPPPPDPTLPEFQKRVQAQDNQSLLEARTSWLEFIEQFPESTKLDEAKDVLGKLNSAIFLSPIPSPEKQTYLVKSGDVISRVAAKAKTTPELLMRANNLSGSMLRIGQKLIIPPSDFSLKIDRRRRKIEIFNAGKFFKQYHMLPAAPAPASASAKATPKPVKIAAKVSDRIAWHNGQRLTYNDKDYPAADHWIVITPGANTLYASHPTAEGQPPPQKPSGGYPLQPEDARELAVLLNKNDQVTID